MTGQQNEMYNLELHSGLKKKNSLKDSNCIIGEICLHPLACIRVLY